MRDINTNKFISTAICNSFFFFFNDTATTEIYTLPLHDALPISDRPFRGQPRRPPWRPLPPLRAEAEAALLFSPARSEEHTSELQSHLNLVCRLLLEKKKKMTTGKGKRQMATTSSSIT